MNIEKKQEYCTYCKTIEIHSIATLIMKNGKPMRKGVCNKCGYSRALPHNYKFRQENGLTQIDFYKSNTWRRLRFEILEANERDNEGRCALCKRNDRPMEVDHVVPRSIDKKKELDKKNLQVLCEDCNRGKSNRSVTDFRSKRLTSPDTPDGDGGGSAA